MSDTSASSHVKQTSSWSLPWPFGGPSLSERVGAGVVKGALSNLPGIAGGGNGPGLIDHASDIMLSSTLEKMLQNLTAYAGDGSESPETARASLATFRASRAAGKSAWEAFVEAFREVNASVAGVDAPTEGIESNPAPHLAKTRAQVLAPPAADTRSTDELEKENNDLIKNYCEKAARLCSMRAVDRFFRLKHADEVYSEMVSEENGRKAYRRTVGGFWGFLIQIPYFIFFHLISPLITQTTQTIASKLRGQLEEKDFLRDIVNEEIGLLTTFFGEVAEAREEYIDPTLRTQKLGDKRAGSFKDFLEETTKVYGEKSLTEEELLKIVQKYIIDNYVPRPNFSIKGFSIPVLFSIGEWIVWKIRCRIINSYLNHTHQLSHWLNQGTQAISYARLSLERLFCEKLSEACLLLEKAEVERLENGGSSSALSAAAKTRVIAEERLDVFGESLIRYLRIRERQGSLQALHNIDPIAGNTRVSSLLTELFAALKQVMPVEAHSIQEIMDLDNHLAHATGLVVEDIFEQLFNDSSSHVEKQLGNIFTLLTNAIDGSGGDESTYAEECIKVHKQLISLIEQLSQLAVKKAVDHHLEDSPKEQLRRDQEMVEKARSTLTSFADSVKKELEFLVASQDVESPETRLASIKTLLAQRCDDLFALTTSEEYRKSLSKNQNMLAVSLGPELSQADSDFLEGLNEIEALYLEEEELKKLQASFPYIAQQAQLLQADTPLEEAKKIIQTITEALNQLPSQVQEKEMQNAKFLFEQLIISYLHSQEAKNEAEIEKLSQEVGSLRDLERGIVNLKQLLRRKNATEEEIFSAFNKIKQSNHPSLSELGIISRVEDLRKIFLPPWYSRKTTPLSSIHRERLTKEKQLEVVRKPLEEINNLSFGLSSSDSEEFAPQILGFSGEVNGQWPFTRPKSTKDASKVPENEGEKPKTQVNKMLAERSEDQTLGSIEPATVGNTFGEEMEALLKKVETQMKRNQESVQDPITKMEAALEQMSAIAARLEVKKLVVLGEKQTKKRAPLAEKYISGEVHKKIGALVGALEDPFIYRQLFIRMFLLPIATRQEVL